MTIDLFWLFILALLISAAMVWIAWKIMAKEKFTEGVSYFEVNAYIKNPI